MSHKLLKKNSSLIYFECIIIRFINALGTIILNAFINELKIAKKSDMI
jgi:hypothetical protein